ncbi:MAG: FAD-dependent oxidoreductase, partial [Myxococcota bacterium]
AASALAERGYRVELFEAKGHLGGKCGGWRERVDGVEFDIDHGFHAFFRQYYNLRGFLERLGLLADMAEIEDYLVVGRDGSRSRFAGLDPAPVLNLLSLAQMKFFRVRDIVLSKARDEMGAFLEYDPELTEETFDDVPFDRFAEEAELPASLRLVFSTFARAFFASEDKLSVAHLIKSFHFYYLSHDYGLVYDHPRQSYRSFIEVIENHLQEVGVAIAKNSPIGRIVPQAIGGYEVDGRRFDHVVLATPSVVTAAIVERSPELAVGAAESWWRRVVAHRPSEGYCVLRVWLDRPFEEDVPVFFATERATALDSITSLHRITEEARDWADENEGSVLELHCYALPPDMDGDAVANQMLVELGQLFPQLKGATALHRHRQLDHDFTSFHVGMGRIRCGTDTPWPGLVLAGDWVELPIPVMLLEAAFSSGLYAANTLAGLDGVRSHPIDSVPPRGVMAFLAPKRFAARRAAGRVPTPSVDSHETRHNEPAPHEEPRQAAE